MNKKTATIFYDQRVIISEPREEPVVWSCSKVEDMSVKGIARYVFKQDQWNKDTDYIEINKDREVIGMWANYYDVNLSPIESQPISTVYSKITCAGTPAIKVDGNYKKFTVTFYDEENPIDYQSGDWTFTIDGKDASELIRLAENGIDENQVKIKFLGNDTYIGKVLKLKFTSDTGIVAYLDVNITGL